MESERKGGVWEERRARAVSPSTPPVEAYGGVGVGSWVRVCAHTFFFFFCTRTDARVRSGPTALPGWWALVPGSVQPGAVACQVVAQIGSEPGLPAVRAYSQRFHPQIPRPGWLGMQMARPP